MCGIIAIVRRRTNRALPNSQDLLDRCAAAVAALPGTAATDLGAALAASTVELVDIDRELRGEAGVRALLADPSLIAGLDALMVDARQSLRTIEAHLDIVGASLGNLEAVNATLIQAKDATWAIERDRLRTARAVDALAGRDPSTASIAAFLSVQQALSALDRLEVRGRDSAGVHILVRGHELDLDDQALAAIVAKRRSDPLFTDGAVRTPDGQLSFVYKAAAEIGELGDNTAAMRAAITNDELLHHF